jgi:hypothetical protein
MSANKAFGKPSLDNNNYESFKYFKMQPPDEAKGETSTTLVARIFGPMHSYVESGAWKFFYGQHYGHTRNNTKNPEKPRAAPFGCIQKKNRDKQVIQACPKCDQMDKVREIIHKREQKIAAANPNASEQQLKELAKKDPVISEQNKWLRANNCDKKFWLNVMNANGEFGVLQLSYTTCEKILVPLLRQLRDRGVDAFDLETGVFFNFTRTGRNFDAIDTITVAQEQIDIGGGRKAFVDKLAPLTPEQIEKAARVLPDLKTGVVKFISFEVMEQLVNSSGDPDETDRIWPEVRKQQAVAPTTTTTVSLDDEEGPPAEDEDTTTVASKPAVQTAAPAQSVVDEVDTSEAELEAKLAALKAKKAAAKAAPAVTKTAAAPSTDKDVEEFLSDFDA